MVQKIPVYKEINDFLAGVNCAQRTQNPNFFCLRIAETYPHTSDTVPPFKRCFYSISMVTHAGSTRVGFDTPSDTALEQNLSSFIALQSPGHIYSWHRDQSLRGYLIYFKPGIFSFLKTDLEVEFPFFNPSQTNFYRIESQTYQELAPFFEEVFTHYYQETVSPAFGPSADQHEMITVLKLLTLLYYLRGYALTVDSSQQVYYSAEKTLFQKFLQLVDNYYLDIRKVASYAHLLGVSPRQLQAAVKTMGQKTALAFIHERLMKEARLQVQFTQVPLMQIADQLKFPSVPAFNRFFARYSGQTPADFRLTRHPALLFPESVPQVSQAVLSENLA